MQRLKWGGLEHPATWACRQHTEWASQQNWWNKRRTMPPKRAQKWALKTDRMDKQCNNKWWVELCLKHKCPWYLRWTAICVWALRTSNVHGFPRSGWDLTTSRMVGRVVIVRSGMMHWGFTPQMVLSRTSWGGRESDKARPSLPKPDSRKLWASARVPENACTQPAATSLSMSSWTMSGDSSADIQFVWCTVSSGGW